MAVFLINPSDHSFGTAVITPRWLYVLAGGHPPLVWRSGHRGRDARSAGALEHPGGRLRRHRHSHRKRLARLRGRPPGARARRMGRLWRDSRDAYTPRKRWSAVTRTRWSRAMAMWSGPRCCRPACRAEPNKIYEGGKIDADQFVAARWDLLPPDKYMWASVQTVRGCPKHCSFCSVWRTDGQRPRQRPFESVIEEIVQLRRKGFRYIALADDNFYPVTLTDLRLAREQKNYSKLAELEQIRSDKFALMAELAKLPKNMVFFTQITMESAEDPDYLDAMRQGEHQGSVSRRRGGDSRRPEVGLQGVQFIRRGPGKAAADFSRAWAAHVGLLHLRPSFGQAGYLQSHGRSRLPGGTCLCPVRHVDALSRVRWTFCVGRRSRRKRRCMSRAFRSRVSG